MWLNSHFMTSDPRRRNGRYKEENRRHSAVFSPHLYTGSDLTTRGRLKSTFVLRGHRWAEKSAHHKLAHRAPSRSFMFLNCRVLLLWRHPFPPLLSPESTRRCFRQSCEGERGEMTHTHADTHTLTHTHIARAASDGNDLPQWRHSDSSPQPHRGGWVSLSVSLMH